MRIEEVKEKYRNEWILAEVLKSDELGSPVEVKLITHSKNRDEVYDALKIVGEGKHICTFYTGRIPKKGYAVAFHGENRV